MREDSPKTPKTRSNVWQRIWDLISGTRTAIWLLVVLGGLCLAGIVYPQSAALTPEQLADWRQRFPVVAKVGELLGLDRAFSTWYFAVALGLTAVSAAACTFRRLITRMRGHSLPTQVPASWTRVDTVFPASSFDEMVDAVWRTIGWLPGSVTVRRNHDTALIASGQVGFWGSMALHVALVVIAIGGAISALTSFHGRMLVSEGETVVDESTSYLSVSNEPIVGTAYSGKAFRLDDMEFQYEGDTLTRAIARVSIVNDVSPTVVTAEVNYPFLVGNKSFLLGNSGYTADLLITGPFGEVDAVYRLGERQQTGYGDTVTLPDGVVLEMFGAPTRDLERGVEVVRRYDLRDPMLYLRASRGSEVLWEGAMYPASTVAFNQYSVSFRRLGYWSELLVRGDRGRMIVYVGLWLAVIGGAVRAIDLDRRVLVKRESEGVSIACRHRLGLASSVQLAERLARSLPRGTFATDDRSPKDGAS